MADGIEKYFWKTIPDGRVRKHKAEAQCQPRVREWWYPRPGDAPRRNRPKRVQKKIDKRNGAATYATDRFRGKVFHRFTLNMFRKLSAMMADMPMPPGIPGGEFLSDAEADELAKVRVTL